jgi:hypothetical protein
VRGQKNEFHALEKFYNYFPQSSIEEIDIPPSNILFFPGQYFSAGLGKQNCSPGQFSFHDTNNFSVSSESVTA